VTVFTSHTGEYRTFGFTEAEARCFDLPLQADIYKPRLNMTTDQVFTTYVKAVNQQGAGIRQVTELLFRNVKTPVTVIFRRTVVFAARQPGSAECVGVHERQSRPVLYSRALQ